MNINILMSAYKSSGFIDKTLQSILDQNISNLKIYVGIDGDDEVYNKLPNVNYYKSKINVGTYVITNSLSKLIKADNDILLPFDSDDIMPTNFLKPYIDAYMRLDPDTNILKLNFKNNGQGKTITGYKTILIKNNLFKKMGGYYNFRVGQDDGLLWRLQREKIHLKQNSNLPCFYRVIREDALTQATFTKHGSNFRKETVLKTKQLIGKNIKSDFYSVDLDVY